MKDSVGTRPHVVTDNVLIRYKGQPINCPYNIDWKAFQEAVDKINKLKEEKA